MVADRNQRATGVADLARGTNQTGVRAYNERLALSLIRRHGALSKADIARLTGLSAQTISIIMRQLDADGLVTRRGRQRGRIGQPSIPYALNPDGALSIGVKIGRRSCDLVMIDLIGNVRIALRKAYDYPTPAAILAFVRSGIGRIRDDLSPTEAARIIGLGIAAPFELWNWEEEIGAPRSVLDDWRTSDLSEDLAGVCPWPIRLCDDATAACGAELVLGNPDNYLDFLYVFIGTFVGGGLVLNGSLYPGRSGNAGAIGSMPILGGAGEAPAQLIRSASIHVLQRQLGDAGRDPSLLWRSPHDWGPFDPLFAAWIDRAAESLAQAIVAAISVVDFQAVIIDGAFPSDVRSEMAKGVRLRIEGFDRRGLSPVTIREGVLGAGAREIGGACLPLLANFARDREVLFKGAV